MSTREYLRCFENEDMRPSWRSTTAQLRLHGGRLQLWSSSAQRSRTRYASWAAARGSIGRASGRAAPQVSGAAMWGGMDDAAVVDFFTRRAPSMSGQTLDTLLLSHPLVRHYIDGTAPRLSIGCDAPDGPTYDLDGSQSTLHAAIRGDTGPRKLTLLNFGSYT